MHTHPKSYPKEIALDIKKAKQKCAKEGRRCKNVLAIKGERQQAEIPLSSQKQEKVMQSNFLVTLPMGKV